MGEWTLSAYAKLLREAKTAGYEPMPVADYLQARSNNALILRHDVDRFPKNALAMGAIEAGLGIRSTFYVRHQRRGFPADTINALTEQGHEIGYHYEVLSRAKGDPSYAIRLFKTELDRLRTLVPVVTTTAHGSPLSKWDNRLFWEYAKPSEFGLLGDGYRDIDFSIVAYFTDTGRTWADTGANLRDRVSSNALTVEVAALADLLEFIQSHQALSICLQTHPERWNKHWIGRVRSMSWDYITNFAKTLLKPINKPLFIKNR